eukprot:6413595-Prymnesium_polylepis.2
MTLAFGVRVERARRRVRLVHAACKVARGCAQVAVVGRSDDWEAYWKVHESLALEAPLAKQLATPRSNDSHAPRLRCGDCGKTFVGVALPPRRLARMWPASSSSQPSCSPRRRTYSRADSDGSVPWLRSADVIWHDALVTTGVPWWLVYSYWQAPPPPAFWWMVPAVGYESARAIATTDARTQSWYSILGRCEDSAETPKERRHRKAVCLQFGNQQSAIQSAHDHKAGHALPPLRRPPPAHLPAVADAPRPRAPLARLPTLGGARTRRRGAGPARVVRILGREPRGVRRAPRGPTGRRVQRAHRAAHHAHDAGHRRATAARRRPAAARVPPLVLRRAGARPALRGLPQPVDAAAARARQDPGRRPRRLPAALLERAARRRPPLSLLAADRARRAPRPERPLAAAVELLADPPRGRRGARAARRPARPRQPRDPPLGLRRG